MAKDKKTGKGAVSLPDKGSKGYACGGKVKGMKAGGAAKQRAGYPMTKSPESPKKK